MKVIWYRQYHNFWIRRHKLKPMNTIPSIKTVIGLEPKTFYYWFAFFLDFQASSEGITNRMIDPKIPPVKSSTIWISFCKSQLTNKTNSKIKNEQTRVFSIN